MEQTDGLEQENVNQEESEIQEPKGPDPAVIERAKEMGWVPEDQFRGDKSLFQPAEEFVKRADQIVPIMRNQMRRYEEKISDLRHEISTHKDTVERIIKMSEKAQEIAYRKAKDELEAKQIEAVTNGDTEAYLRFKRESDNLKEPEKVELPKSVEQQAGNQEPPEFKEWSKENQWYRTDEEATLFADAYATKHPYKGSSPAEYVAWLESAKGATQRAFPHKFTNPARQSPSAVNTGGLRGDAGATVPKKNSYENLPAEAKKQCNKEIAAGRMTKEMYVKLYYEEE